MFKLLTLVISLLLLNSCYAENKTTTLYDFRFWSSPDRTRIVIDTDPDIKFSITQNKERFTIDIHNAKLLKSTYKKLFFTDKRIVKTRIKRNKTIHQLTFNLATEYQIKSYTLKPNKKYKYHRLVIDLSDLANKTPIKVEVTKPSNNKATDKIILIDAGHGGEDPGAIGRRKTLEKRITLSIAKKLARMINKTRDMKAILTRTGDYYVSLSKRINIAQDNKASLLVSIHADSVESPKANGASIYTLSKRGGLTKFAKKLEHSQNTTDQFGVAENMSNNDQYLNKILWDLSRKDRNIQSKKLGKNILRQLVKIGYLHKKTVQQAGFVVLKTPAIPSVLIETAFISNP
ncbi:N-acetylmuramoyl-L-alanine amidase, partial [Candidatus Thioglobus sp.]|uniref:N-acetylmuramoyl-L-alanine amidase n=1 Tax=Candidatus Thioglobus sp. TaxID=2026721 RepID=UPI00261723CB